MDNIGLARKTFYFINNFSMKYTLDMFRISKNLKRFYIPSHDLPKKGITRDFNK